jgi:hypothetical protein
MAVIRREDCVDIPTTFGLGYRPSREGRTAGWGIATGHVTECCEHRAHLSWRGAAIRPDRRRSASDTWEELIASQAFAGHAQSDLPHRSLTRDTKQVSPDFC